MLAIRGTVTAADGTAVLNCRRLPARVGTSEAAVLLGFREHDIAVLVAAKLLIALGKPAHNAPKYFAAVELLMHAEDREWLSHATKAVSAHWARKNARKA